jgi:phosphopantetheine adenylyltransferase
LKADFILRGLRNPADFELKATPIPIVVYQNRNCIFIDSRKKPVYQFQHRERCNRNGGEYEMLVPDAAKVK